MKKKNKIKDKEIDDGYKDDDPSDPDCPVGKMTRIPNFLPPPSELIFPGDETEKVTIVLKKDNVDFFRRKAKEHHTKYQKMIREVLDRYVTKYSAS